MKRSTFIIGLAATALVLSTTALSAGATEVAPPTATEWTEWISDDGGSAGRELPAVSADGRYVVMSGRSSAYAGVWIKDRAQLDKPAWRVATGSLFNPVVKSWDKGLEPRGLVTQAWRGLNDADRLVHSDQYTAVMKAVDPAGNRDKVSRGVTVTR